MLQPRGRVLPTHASAKVLFETMSKRHSERMLLLQRERLNSWNRKMRESWLGTKGECYSWLKGSPHRRTVFLRKPETPKEDPHKHRRQQVTTFRRKKARRSRT